MDYRKLVNSLTPEIVANFKRGIELGHWPDGRALTAEQREHCMQAIIAYDQLNLSESDRVGFIDTESKQGGACNDGDVQPISWKNQK